MCLKMIVQLDINLKEYLFVIDSISDVDDILYEKFKSVQKDILRKGSSTLELFNYVRSLNTIQFIN